MNFRTKVFLRANEIYKTSGNWSEALRKSWAIYRLTKQMKQTVVEFQYKKVDGTVRKAYGTLKISIVELYTKGSGKANDKSVAYFDIQTQSFRSFKVENLI